MPVKYVNSLLEINVMRVMQFLTDWKGVAKVWCPKILGSAFDIFCIFLDFLCLFLIFLVRWQCFMDLFCFICRIKLKHSISTNFCGSSGAWYLPVSQQHITKSFQSFNNIRNSFLNRSANAVLEGTRIFSLPHAFKSFKKYLKVSKWRNLFLEFYERKYITKGHFIRRYHSIAVQFNVLFSMPFFIFKIFMELKYFKSPPFSSCKI